MSLFRSPKVNIIPMPIQESLDDRLARLHRKASIYQRFKGQAAVLLGHEDVGDADMLLVVDAEDSLVESPVMQLTERDAVFHVIGAVEGAALRPLSRRVRGDADPVARNRSACGLTVKI